MVRRGSSNSCAAAPDRIADVGGDDLEAALCGGNSDDAAAGVEVESCRPGVWWAAIAARNGGARPERAAAAAREPSSATAFPGAGGVRQARRRGGRAPGYPRE